MKISSFFKSKKIIEQKHNEKKITNNKKLLNIDIPKAEKILENVSAIKKEILEKYRLKQTHKQNVFDIKKITRKIDKHFEVLSDTKVKEIISLFERPVPFVRKYWKRIAVEFSLIRSKNFFEVFKQVKEILLMTKQYPHVIRGSAGCSLVCYLMKITDLDPIYLDIPLTRFMHVLREDIPDIDIDFPALDRDKIFHMIYSRWEGQVARISNHVLFKEKSAIKEAIRQNGHRKFIPRDFEVEDIFTSKKKIEKVYDDAQRLKGKFRNYSLHCGGIVIFDKPVPEELVLQKIADDRGCQIKLNKDEVEDANFIKIDILSNRGLSQLWDISQRKIIDYPHDDKNIYEFFSKGENLGLTYGESRGMRKIFVEMKPKSIHDIAAALALIRPAAAKNGQKFDYLRTYHIPNEVKKNDFVIFDDDAIEYIARILNISLSEADLYRKAFAKNRWAKKNEFRTKLKQENPYMNNDDVQFIIDKLDSLQSYSFCKSHAYSYAYLLYALAYQKYYNPKKFWESTIKNCSTGYRKWTHFRAAIVNGVKIRKKNLKTFRGSLYEIQKNEYFSNGFWSSSEFLEGQYLKYSRNILKPVEKRKKSVRCSFKGIIATYKIYKSDKKIKSMEENKKKVSRFITFVTIGYNNNKYIDIVLWGCHKLSKTHCISGTGIYNEGHWVKADKVKYCSL